MRQSLCPIYYLACDVLWLLDDDDDVHTVQSSPDVRSRRSLHVGRRNVKAVRAARKATGLSQSFERSNPLLVEFADNMKMSGCSDKDIHNKV